MVKNKKCNRCGCTKALELFPRNGKYYRNQCKLCLRKYHQEYNTRPEVRQRDKERRATLEFKARKRAATKREYAAIKADPVRAEAKRKGTRVRLRKRYATDPEYRRKKLEQSRGRDMRAYDKMRRARDTKKISARKRLQEAVKAGRVVRPGRCEECGKKGKTTGHHEDYTKALVVEWLCTTCHGKQHQLA